MLNTKQTHEDDYGEEYDLDIGQIASLPNIEQIRRYQVPANSIGKVLRTTHKDVLVERLTKHNDEMSFIQDGQNYPGLTQQIAIDLSSVTRKISGRELTDGNREAKRSELVNDM